MRDGVIKFWSSSDVLLRQLGQERASSIKDYLVDKANWKMTACTSSTPTWRGRKRWPGRDANALDAE
jgi:hypothetical protein